MEFKIKIPDEFLIKSMERDKKAWYGSELRHSNNHVVGILADFYAPLFPTRLDEISVRFIREEESIKSDRERTEEEKVC